MRAALPAVPAWCWPQQQAEARLQLEHCWPLDLSGRAAATSADASRAASYAAEAPRRALRAQAGSLATYLDALQIQISFEMASPPLQITSPPLESPPLEGCRFKEAERLVQLRERTNQFNSWRRPLPASGLASLDGGQRTTPTKIRYACSEDTASCSYNVGATPWNCSILHKNACVCRRS